MPLRRRSFTRWARSFLSVGFLSFWIVLGLVATSGPAQASTVSQPLQTSVYANALVDEPGNVSDWICDWSLACSFIRSFIPRDTGADQYVVPPAGGSSSGSWGPVQPGTGSTPGAAGSQTSLDAFVLINERAWSQNLQFSGNDLYWGLWWVFQTCGNSAGAMTTSIAKGGTLMGPNYRTHQLTGTCPAGMALVRLQSSPEIPPQPGKMPPINLPYWSDPAWKDKINQGITYRVTLDCFTNTGDPNSTMDDTVDTFTVEYSGAAGGFVYPSCNERLPGSSFGGAQWQYQLPGSPPNQWNPMMENRPDRSSYPPECYYDGCPLRVRYKGSDCQVGSVVCSDWTRSRQTDPTSYECWWGPKKKAISNCFVLERAYQLVAVKATPGNTDGDPDTGDGTTTPGTGGGGGVPSTVEIPATSPNDPAGEDSSCYPSGLAVLNPIEWVLRPLKCALQWAFVPSGSFFPDLSLDLSNAWGASSPGKWTEALSGMTSGLSVDSGECSFPTIVLPGQFGGPIDIESHLCSGVMVPIRNVAYAGMSALLVVGGALTCVRLLGASVGYQTGGGGS